MARDIPDILPEWASSPPASPPTTIVEPTAAQKAAGWQPAGSVEYPDGKPIREHANWLDNLAYQWFEWLSQSAFRTSDLASDQVFPGVGSAPSLGAGLGPVAAGDFSAAAYSSGFRVPETESPLHTYNPLSDTYWDLGRDCAWTPVAVAATAPPPPVTPNSVRVFAVRTDSSDRTLLLLDNLTSRTHLWLNRALRSIGQLAVAGQLEIGAQTDDDALPGTGTPPDFDALVARVIGTGRGSGGQVAWQLAEFGNEAVGVRTIRVYVGVGQNRGQVLVTSGARLTAHSAPEWTSDADAPDVFRLVLGADDSSARVRLRAEQISGIGGGAPFAESAWGDPDQPNQLEQVDLGGGVRIGADLNFDAGGTSVNKTPHVQHVRNDGFARYTLLREDRSTALAWREYSGANMFGSLSTGRLLTWNARWDEAALVWRRDDNAQDSFAQGDWRFGVYAFSHPSSGGNTWADTVSPVTWRVASAVGVAPGSLAARIPSTILAGAYDPGFEHGYAQPIRVRRVFDAMRGAIAGVDIVSGDMQFGPLDPSIVLNAGQAQSNFPAGQSEVYIPFRMPHDSTLVQVELLGTGNAAGRPSIGVWRDDLNAVGVSGAWEQLQSGGYDATKPQTNTRQWHTVAGLDTGLTVDNIRYRYAVVARCPPGGQATVQAIRVTCDAPYNTMLD